MNDPGEMMVRTAMVMAAGLGKRMRPLTATMPKPLVRVAGKPLIDHVFDRLAEAGVGRVVINLHYLADALQAHLRRAAKSFDLVFSDERARLMDTGGGLVAAAPLIAEERFFCINSDNIWIDGPSNSLRNLARRWDDAKMDALLLVVPHNRAFNHRGLGDFRLDAAGRVSRRMPQRAAPFIYTGIQLISKRLLRYAPDVPFSTNLLWDRAIVDGRLYGLVHEGLWFDVGTPAAIRPTEIMLADG